MRIDRVDVVLIELLLYSLYQFEKPGHTKKIPAEVIQNIMPNIFLRVYVLHSVQ